MTDTSSARLESTAAEATLAHSDESIPWGLLGCYLGFLAIMVWRIF